MALVLPFQAVAQSVDPTHPMVSPLRPGSPGSVLDSHLRGLPALAPVRLGRETGAGSAVFARDLVPPGPVEPVRPFKGIPGAGFEGTAMVAGSRNVIGTDNRTVITNTTAFPWRAQAKVFVTFPSNRTFVASGTLVGDRYLLTAGSNVYRREEGGWATKLQAWPGLRGNLAPYGRAFATKYRTYLAWMQRQDPAFNIALVTLDRRIGLSTGFLPFGSVGNPRGETAHLAAYPTDLGGGNFLYYGIGTVSAVTAGQIRHTADVGPGYEGAGLYRIAGQGTNALRLIIGVQAGTDASATNPANIATRITPGIAANLRSWIASGT